MSPARRPALVDHPRYRWYVLTVCMVGVAATSFPTTLLSASLPLIADDLDTRLSVISWVSVAPSIAFALGLPLFGRLGDLYGHRRVYLVGFGLATLFALLTALSPNAETLITLRTVGQLAGSAASPAALALLASVFPPEERNRAFGFHTSVLAIAPVFAVVVGGPVIEAIGWRALFVAQAVPAAIAVAVAIPLLPETPRQRSVRFDAAGATALGVGLVGSLFAINRVGEWGVDHTLVQLAALAGVVGAVAFVIVERRIDHPLVPLSLFTRRASAAPIATNGLSQLSYIGSFAIAPFLVSRLFGFRTYGTALILAIRPTVFSAAAWLAGRHEARFGVRRVQAVANATLAVSALVTAVGAWQRSLALVVVGLALSGLGQGYGRPSLIASVTNAVEPTEVGVANGVNNMVASIGASIGTTVLIAVVGESTTGGPFAWASLLAAAAAAAALATGLQMGGRRELRDGPLSSPSATG
jgi:MFS family permease